MVYGIPMRAMSEEELVKLIRNICSVIDLSSLNYYHISQAVDPPRFNVIASPQM